MIKIKNSLIIVAMLVIASITKAKDPEKERAKKKIIEATLKMPRIRHYKKNTEKLFYKKTGTSKKMFKYLLIGKTMVDGDISTKHFKNLRYRKGDFYILPAIDYNYKTNAGRGIATFKLEF